MRQLTLAISGITTTLKRFTAYDRTLISTGDTEYSIVGTPLDSGPFYEPKHIWTISAMVTPDQKQALGAIFSKCDSARRTQSDYRIVVSDSIENFVEDGGRTRGLASGGSVTSFSGGVEYPAVFYARMFEPKYQWQRNGVYPYVANFILRELDKYTA